MDEPAAHAAQARGAEPDAERSEVDVPGDAASAPEPVPAAENTSWESRWSRGGNVAPPYVPLPQLWFCTSGNLALPSFLLPIVRALEAAEEPLELAHAAEHGG